MSEEKKASDAAGVELVSGSISLPSAEENTLDEPVSTTILRDLRLVGGKLRVVLMPSNTSEETLKALRDWDLWGPLLLCLTLSIMLSVTAPAAQSAMVFTGVFVVIWVGAAIVTINAQLLGSSMYVFRIIFPFFVILVLRGMLMLLPSRSFFQSVCVLGYCVFPLNIATLVCMLAKVVVSHILLRMIIVSVGFLWSTRGTSLLMTVL
ncbi:hypothetical protein, variant 2 [Phytophthora nicotianae P10297]|uniref:Protein YIPF n=6 Tax=Phytophthora nicotianae TaxID=4792 RepID=V9FJS6_PHYNI|nr:hypothetical protein, variant 2 [Phytophthora nicotianae P1569]ETL43997.1 hypothetical protein, variant 2 [Phytophthora nicotianae]ETL97178.1 hypothetical protein, variant 2 [Phytophthora nicotianae]ETM50332.1 hypothetical protein, variant 2 [Phytophthora nicotianae]ETP48426.1 hypothetical protein, variant 2 [Phytophthora nicotianae P10297]